MKTLRMAMLAVVVTGAAVFSAFAVEVVGYNVRPVRRDATRATRTNMGSGRFAEQRWQWSAFQRNLLRQARRQGTFVKYRGVTWATDPTRYSIEEHFTSAMDWESFMWLGGPGAG
jgi:hypothetical protein